MSAALSRFLAGSPDVALLEVTRARGSTPREQGAWMLVSPVAIFETIGGGALEFMAIERAREALAAGEAGAGLDVPLGPEIGQCCGGRVELSIRILDPAGRAALVERAAAAEAALPRVLVFGGGHVGHALAAAFALLPVRVVVVETRAEALAGMPDEVEARLTPVPEEAVREAPPGSAYVVLTHDHSLDFLIVAEAMRRTDAAYVGMIGSKTKLATFSDLARLVCPIGGDSVPDKRPAVIAALAAAEIIAALAA